MNERNLPTAEERYRALPLIRRLLAEQGLVHWRKYAIAFILMAVSAGCTAFSAYLIGDVINQAYVNRNLPGIIFLGAITVVLFSAKGLATYGHSVVLSRIGNRIVADNQRAVFSKLLTEGLGFFSDRHSTEFIARLSSGAAAATQVINLLITSVGRDLLSLIGLVTVMVVQDPVLSFFSFVVAPPAFFVLRKLIRRIYSIARTQFHGGTRIIETLQETLQGIRIVKAFTLEDTMATTTSSRIAPNTTCLMPGTSMPNDSSRLRSPSPRISIKKLPRMGPNNVPTPPAIGPRMMSIEREILNTCSGNRLL